MDFFASLFRKSIPEEVEQQEEVNRPDVPVS
jgi:hypothetical protein